MYIEMNKIDRIILANDFMRLPEQMYVLTTYGKMYQLKMMKTSHKSNDEWTIEYCPGWFEFIDDVCVLKPYDNTDVSDIYLDDWRDGKPYKKLTVYSQLKTKEFTADKIIKFVEHCVMKFGS